eukprot:SAG25_NODE_577_length_6782_cov_26.651504_2_plen_176_part_00
MPWLAADAAHVAGSWLAPSLGRGRRRRRRRRREPWPACATATAAAAGTCRLRRSLAHGAAELATFSDLGDDRATDLREDVHGRGVQAPLPSDLGLVLVELTRVATLVEADSGDQVAERADVVQREVAAVGLRRERLVERLAGRAPAGVHGVDLDRPVREPLELVAPLDVDGLAAP